MRESGFTLIELIVIIVLIGILSSVALVKYRNLTQQVSRDADIANSKAIQSAILIHYSKKISANPGYSVADAVAEYGKAADLFFQDGQIPKKANGSNFSVSYVNGELVIQ